MNLSGKYMSNQDLKRKIEALIFSFGEGISIDEIKRRTNADELIIKRIINKLNKEYDERESAFFIETEGNKYLMKLRPDLLSVIKDTVKIEMKKGTLMTLSVIALHDKMKQSDLIKMRGNIAYKHVKELIEKGLIEPYFADGKKHLKLTEAFFNYFDIEKNEFKELKQELDKNEEGENKSIVEYKGK